MKTEPLSRTLAPFAWFLLLMIMACGYNHSTIPKGSGSKEPEHVEPPKPLPKDEVQACEWAVKEAIDEYASSLQGYRSARAEKMRFERDKTLLPPSDKWTRAQWLKELGQRAAGCNEQASWWQTEIHVRAEKLREALERNPGREPEFDWTTYEKQSTENPEAAEAARKMREEINLWKAERKRIDQAHLDAQIKDQEREIIYLKQEVQKQQEEMVCLRQKYFDIRSAAEATDGANADRRKDVQDAKAALEASERELNLRKTKLDNARKALDQLKARK